MMSVDNQMNLDLQFELVQELMCALNVKNVLIPQR